MGKRANGEGCVRKKKKSGYWEAIITVGYDNNGKQLSKYFTAKTKEAVTAKKNRYIADMQKGFCLKFTRMTVGEWLDYWYNNHVIDKVKIKTQCDYESSIRCHLKPRLGGIKLTELRGMHIQQCYNDLARNGRVDKTGGLSAKTIRNIHVAFRRALEQAVNDDLLMKTPIRGVSLPRQDKPDKKILTPEQQKSLEKECFDHPWGMVILLTLFTGMRLGEVTGLTWADVNFKEGIISVNKQAGRIQTFSTDGKKKTDLCLRYQTKTASSNRNIPIPPIIMEHLTKHKKEQDMHRKKFKAVYNDLNLVFCRENGNLLDPKTFRTFYLNTLTKAGIGHRTFHALRHTFATRALELNLNPKTVADILGHANVQTTLNTYSHVSPEIKKEVMQQIVDKFYDI